MPNTHIPVATAGPPGGQFELDQASGGWSQVNHPAIYKATPVLCRGCAWNYTDPETAFSKLDAIELQTGPAAVVVFGGFAAANPYTPDAIAYYEHALDTGAHIAAVGSSDDHQGGTGSGGTYAPVGRASTMVYATELSRAGIIAGIKGDHTYVKGFGNSSPTIDFTGDIPNRKQPAIIGDVVKGAVAEFKVTITGAASTGRAGNWSLVLLKDGKPFSEIPFSGNSFTRAFDATGTGRYALEVIRTDGPERFIENYTSPIWFTDVKAKNKFGFRVKRKRNGTAVAIAKVPGEGVLTMGGAKVKRAKKRAKKKGRVKVPIRPKGTPQGKVRFKIGFKPTGGKRRTKGGTVRLRAG
jgi:hypothetical protein